MLFGVADEVEARTQRTLLREAGMMPRLIQTIFVVATHALGWGGGASKGPHKDAAAHRKHRGIATFGALGGSQVRQAARFWHHTDLLPA